MYQQTLNDIRKTQLVRSLDNAYLHMPFIDYLSIDLADRSQVRIRNSTSPVKFKISN